MIVWIWLLFLAGMVLIIAEFLLPGGVLGGIGAIMLIVSTVAGVRAYPEAAMLIIVGELLGAFLCVLAGLFLLTKTKAGKAIALEKVQLAEEGYVNMPSETSLVGSHGTVFTALRPAGTIMVDGRRIDAVSDGVFLDEGARVRIIEVNGNRVLVEADEDPPEAEPGTGRAQ